MTNQPRLIALVLASLLAGACGVVPSTTREGVHQELDAMRDRKRAQLEAYMEDVARRAAAADDDEEMKRLFADKQALFHRHRGGEVSQDAAASLARVRDAIENAYIERYLVFSDILFIDPAGEVFYTVRRQGEYHANVFEGALGETALARRLREGPGEAFIDFQDYAIQGRPAAFFVRPCERAGRREGWFVFLFAINRINDMFSREALLGATGEVFLVNRDCAMLTDSRFFAESSVLSRHLSPANIDQKFAERRGHKTVIDYRGRRAMTSFEVVSVLGSEWLLVAKIDEDEVLTRMYRERREELLPRLLELSALSPAQRDPDAAPIPRQIEVDMDEFQRVADGRSLHTHGVSTCAAVLITRPGHFAYLAHLSANDRLYGGQNTDLLPLMLKRIEDFEVVQAARGELSIVLVTPDIRHTASAVDELVARGYLLRQIRLLHSPAARYANVTHSPEEGRTFVSWRPQGEGAASWALNAEDLPDLGRLMRSLSVWGD